MREKDEGEKKVAIETEQQERQNREIDRGTKETEK